MRLAVIVATVLIAPASAISTTIHVPKDYSTIQEAIDAALAGDTVLVAPGTYMEIIDFKGKAITVKSSDGAGETVIDGKKKGSVISFRNGEGSESILEGFTVTNGSGTLENESYRGGGVYCLDSSPILRQNVISNNNINPLPKKVYGGGIYCGTSSPLIEYNTVSNNSANAMVGFGGGICCMEHSNPVIVFNAIIDNKTTWQGGGIHCSSHSSPAIAGNILSDNSSGHAGGGIACEDFSLSTVHDNSIIGNSAESLGGGIFCIADSVTDISHNLISGNSAEGLGGGIACAASPLIHNNRIQWNSANEGGGVHCEGAYSIQFTNNIIAENLAFFGGGIALSMSEPMIIGNTITGNVSRLSGGGMGVDFAGSAIVTNTILWRNHAKTGPAVMLSLAPAEVTLGYSDVEGGQAGVHANPNCTIRWGSGMIDADPLFVHAFDGDYHLRYDSPCKDAGSSWIPELPAEDFEGDPRIAYGSADMGADEFAPHLYTAGDLVVPGSIALKVIGLPLSLVMLYAGSGTIEPPLNTRYGDWYLQFPLVFQVGLGGMPPEGFLEKSIRLPPGTPTPWDIPLQSLTGVELTNLCVVELK